MSLPVCANAVDGAASIKQAMANKISGCGEFFFMQGLKCSLGLNHRVEALI
jgi:hypothetical protein